METHKHTYIPTHNSSQHTQHIPHTTQHIHTTSQTHSTWILFLSTNYLQNMQKFTTKHQLFTPLPQHPLFLIPSLPPVITPHTPGIALSDYLHKLLLGPLPLAPLPSNIILYSRQDEKGGKRGESKHGLFRKRRGGKGGLGRSGEICGLGKWF